MNDDREKDQSTGDELKGNFEKANRAKNILDNMKSNQTSANNSRDTSGRSGNTQGKKSPGGNSKDASKNSNKKPGAMAPSTNGNVPKSNLGKSSAPRQGLNSTAKAKALKGAGASKAGAAVGGPAGIAAAILSSLPGAMGGSKNSSSNSNSSSALVIIVVSIICIIILIPFLFVNLMPNIIWNEVFHTNKTVDEVPTSSEQKVKELYDKDVLFKREQDIADIIGNYLNDAHGDAISDIEAYCNKTGADIDETMANLIDTVEVNNVYTDATSQEPTSKDKDNSTSSAGIISAGQTIPATKKITGRKIANFTKKQKTTYLKAGDTLSGADSDGFVKAVYANFGIQLPRMIHSQKVVGKSISKKNIQKGDLVFSGNSAAIAITKTKVCGIVGTEDVKTFTLSEFGSNLSIRRVVEGGSGLVENTDIKKEYALPKGINLSNAWSWQPRLVQSNYSITLWTGYGGFKLANNRIPGKKMTKGKHNIAKVNNDYVIALGSFYCHNSGVGEKRYVVTMQNNGKIYQFTAILGDVKSDKHTDANHQYHRSDKSVIEFSTWNRKGPSIDINQQFPGKIVGIAELKTSASIDYEGGGGVSNDGSSSASVISFSLKDASMLFSSYSVSVEQMFPNFEDIKDQEVEGGIKSWLKEVSDRITSIVKDIRQGRIFAWLDPDINYEKDIAYKLKKYQNGKDSKYNGNGFYKVTYAKNGNNDLFEKSVDYDEEVIKPTSNAIDTPETETIKKTKTIKYLKPTIKFIDIAEISFDMFGLNLKDTYKIGASNTSIEEAVTELSKRHLQVLHGADKDGNVEGDIYLSKSGSSGKWSGGKLAWPVPGHYRITSEFDPRRVHPRTGVVRPHNGMDIGCPTGTRIVSCEDGTVSFSGWINGGGNTVKIEHGGGLQTVYMHNSSISVKVGDTVLRGDTIAKAGATGLVTGPHCHLETRVNGKPINPRSFLKFNR